MGRVSFRVVVIGLWGQHAKHVSGRGPVPARGSLLTETASIFRLVLSSALSPECFSTLSLLLPGEEDVCTLGNGALS